MASRKVYTSIVDFDDLDLAEAAQKVRQLSYESTFSYVVTPNIDHLSRLCSASANDYLRQIYLGAAITLCDSRIINKILRSCGKQLKAVVPGSDLTEYLFNEILSADARILIFGCEDQHIEILRQRYPNLTIQHINPSMGFINRQDEVDELIEQIKEHNADYIFLCVGSPRQELLAERLKHSGLSRGVALCVGASVNFMIGVETRAPKWVQSLNMEWCYRMLQDPKRLVKRYTLNAMFLPKIIKLLSRPQ